jgi:hypothetical protein
MRYVILCQERTSKFNRVRPGLAHAVREQRPQRDRFWRRSTSTAFAASRSQHPGRVNSLFDDGSIHFKGTFNPTIGTGLSATQAGKPINIHIDLYISDCEM